MHAGARLASCRDQYDLCVAKYVELPGQDNLEPKVLASRSH
jgi:hypothetical protein